MNKKTIGIILALVVIIGGVIWWRSKDGNDNPQTSSDATAVQVLKPAINGVEVEESIARLRPIAVMIENHSQSRPQSGLTDADIVYETLAEGGITRFMALFQTRQPQEIGPIRSVRPYFSFLANQWHAVLAHSGGSPTALQELRVGLHRNVADADEFFNGSYFKRDTSRFAPHNLYTSGELLRKFVSDKKHQDWSMDPEFQFAAIPTSELAPTITEITIPFSTASYLVKYAFDPATDTYKRSIGNVATIDKNNQLQVSPKNVIVQFAEAALIPGDATGAMNFRLDKSGKIYVFTGGKLVPGTWNHQSGKIHYKDNAGNPITIQPGQTWIEIVPTAMQNLVTWK